MKVCVMRLPGGGQIKSVRGKDTLPWWGYRNYEIDITFYRGVIETIRKHPEWSFIFVSGGVGAFIYTEFARNLNIDSNLLAETGCEIVSILNKILIRHFQDNLVSVFSKEVQIKDIANTLNKNQCVFIQPHFDYTSTDSLATYAAKSIEAEVIFFFKKGAPVYHLGFNQPTLLKEWKIDDLIRRSEHVRNVSDINYLIDHDSLLLIKSNKLNCIIFSPDSISSISLNSLRYGDIHHEFSTSIRN